LYITDNILPHTSGLNSIYGYNVTVLSSIIYPWWWSPVDRNMSCSIEN